jgi:hypothetical protein
MAQMVLGVFGARDMAENAINELQELGYNPKDMSIIMRDRDEAVAMGESTGASVAEGALSGATTGGVLGGIAGLLIGVGAIAIPGLGALLVGGPIAAALGLTGAAATTVSGAVTGALAGGLVGALMGLGVSEEDARYYEDRIREGGILVAVPVSMGRHDEVREVLEDHGADQVRMVSDESSVPRRGYEEGAHAHREPAYFERRSEGREYFEDADEDVVAEKAEVVEPETPTRPSRARKTRR